MNMKSLAVTAIAINAAAGIAHATGNCSANATTSVQYSNCYSKSWYYTVTVYDLGGAHPVDSGVYYANNVCASWIACPNGNSMGQFFEGTISFFSNSYGVID